MFNQKQSSLFEENSSRNSVNSAFVNAGLKKSAQTLSGNGALKYATTGDPFVDQFGMLGSYKKPRNYSEIEKDCEELWRLDKRYATLFTFYIRMITRDIIDPETGETIKSQRGAELKYEGIMRMIWLQINHPNAFWDNISIAIAIGSWKDVIMMLQYDLIFHGWEGRKLNWKRFGDVILSGLQSESQNNLLKKYLPQVKARSKCKTVESQADTMIAKWICSLLKINYVQYRQLKTSGTCHEWQKLISQRRFNEIKFDDIHGRALNLLVKSKFLTNNNLKSKYEAWVTNPNKKELKYTGFVHELFDMCIKYGSQSRMPVHEQETVNKQFATLVKKGGESEQTSLIVVRDTSGSMGSAATGTNMSCYNIAKALALYFSEFLSGKFANSWIEFNSSAKMHTWKGNDPVSRWFGDTSSYVGSTNFQSVIELFCQIKRSGVIESEFPTGILCISDGEFNPTQLNTTNVDAALQKLKSAGFSNEYVNNFVIVLWNLQSRAYGDNTGKKFETYGNARNVFYFSGYSAATVAFLTSKIQTASELFKAAMDQEILRKLIIK